MLGAPPPVASARRAQRAELCSLPGSRCSYIDNVADICRHVARDTTCRPKRRRHHPSRRHKDKMSAVGCRATGPRTVHRYVDLTRPTRPDPRSKSKPTRPEHGDNINTMPRLPTRSDVVPISASGQRRVGRGCVRTIRSLVVRLGNHKNQRRRLIDVVVHGFCGFDGGGCCH